MTRRTRQLLSTPLLLLIVAAELWKERLLKGS